MLGLRIVAKMATTSLIIPGLREYSPAKVSYREADFVSHDVVDIMLLKLMCCFANNRDIALTTAMDNMTWNIDLHSFMSFF